MPRGKGIGPTEQGRRRTIRALMTELPTPSATAIYGMFDKAESEAWAFIANAYMPKYPVNREEWDG